MTLVLTTDVDTLQLAAALRSRDLVASAIRSDQDVEVIAAVWARDTTSAVDAVTPLVKVAASGLRSVAVIAVGSGQVPPRQESTPDRCEV